MKNRKINLDRPRIDSKEIQSHKDFNQVLENFNAMSKPFYKSTWFFGTTGLASLGLIIGGTIAFQAPDNQVTDWNVLTSEAPPAMTVPDNSIIALNTNFDDTSSDLAKETLKPYSNHQLEKPIENEQNKTLYDNTSTLNENTETTERTNLEVPESTDEVGEELVANDKSIVGEEEERKVFNRIDMSPRISGKLDGRISRKELLDVNGLTTAADVDVISFELHLIDGYGGRVLKEESNQLNADMRSAIDRVLVGETIYFENIMGQSKGGEVVRLNPLRYTLLN